MDDKKLEFRFKNGTVIRGERPNEHFGRSRGRCYVLAADGKWRLIPRDTDKLDAPGLL